MVYNECFCVCSSSVHIYTQDRNMYDQRYTVCQMHVLLESNFVDIFVQHGQSETVMVMSISHNVCADNIRCDTYYFRPTESRVKCIQMPFK